MKTFRKKLLHACKKTERPIRKFLGVPFSEENIAKVKSIVEQLHEQMNNQDFETAVIADDLTTANLQNELALIDRLDAMIDRAIKRLLMVRGIKSPAVSPVSGAFQDAPIGFNFQLCLDFHQFLIAFSRNGNRSRDQVAMRAQKAAAAWPCRNARATW